MIGFIKKAVKFAKHADEIESIVRGFIDLAEEIRAAKVDNKLDDTELRSIANRVLNLGLKIKKFF